MKRLSISVLVGLACCVGARAGWISEIEISSEPTEDGQVDYSVRILPGKTHQCDKIVFECVYHQKFPWENARGKKYIKVHEPVSFAYRRRDVGLVDSLDTHISFRVPLSRKRLVAAYGDKVFQKEYPITISRMKITATSAGETRWSYDLKADGMHDLTRGRAE